MNPEEKKKNTPQVELNDEELEEVAGGERTKRSKCYCPTCNRYFDTLLTTCPFCKFDDGVTSYVVPV